MGKGHIDIYNFYICIKILKRFIKTSEKPDMMLTKAKKKKKLHSNWHFRDLDFPYFKTERVLFTLPWKLFKDVYF